MMMKIFESILLSILLSFLLHRIQEGGMQVLLNP